MASSYRGLCANRRLATTAGWETRKKSAVDEHNGKNGAGGQQWKRRHFLYSTCIYLSRRMAIGSHTQPQIYFWFDDISDHLISRNHVPVIRTHDKTTWPIRP